MPAWIIHWLQTAAWRDVALVFLLENAFIFALAIILGGWLVARFPARRVALPPTPLTAPEIGVALLNVLLNTATTLAGLWLWRRGIITFRTDVGLFAVLDVFVLLLGMDALMYALHRLAHVPVLYRLLHQYHHRYVHPRPLTLFALNPLENLAFGGLWLAFITVYPASWAGMSVYLALNVAFGTIGHLGVEPCPAWWVRSPLLSHLAGSSFHAQHHQDLAHNFGFYTLFWDRILGTLRPTYNQDFGHVANLPAQTLPATSRNSKSENANSYIGA